MMETEPFIVWEPSEELKAQSRLRAFMNWLSEQKRLHFDTYHELWQWSVTEIEKFWMCTWEFFDVHATSPYRYVVSGYDMPGARWFDGAMLNFAQHVFRNATHERPAMIFQSEGRPLSHISWEELTTKVASVSAALRAMGIRRGDRVAAFLPNIPEAVIAFLACASIGAIWSSCSPDFGVMSVVDRFKQIEPRVLLTVDGYMYGGKVFDRRPTISAIQKALPTLETTVLVPYLYRTSQTAEALRSMAWRDLITFPPSLDFIQLPFDHPLWVLYSSGTTGLPKPIVHGHGGIILELMKGLGLHLDLQANDRFFWQTTTGWMMWNFLIGGLLLGCTIVLYDGSPVYPDMNTLWKFAQDSRMTFFGTSAAYISACTNDNLAPSNRYYLNRIRGVGSTGSPLTPEGFDWIYEHIHQDVMLASISGGTDVCTAFVGSCPLLPIYRGEIQCRWLGANVDAFDEEGNSLIDTMGELVVKSPMPSMPLYLWNDYHNTRYQSSYFALYPGVWRHGDWAKVTERGSVVIYGRSDSTINRLGIRMGTSELYRAVESFPEIHDSLVVDVTLPEREAYMPLFVVLEHGITLDEELMLKIKAQMRSLLSPRHVPDDIFAVAEVPYTLSGKKMEVPVRRILMGEPVQQVANPDSMRNPDTLHYFVEMAKHLHQKETR